MPTILGHEIVGHVVAIGPEAPAVDAAGRTLGVGDRVTWAVVASCGGCFYCLRGLPQKCEAMLKYGHEPLRPGGEWTGGLAAFCRLAPNTAIFRVPDGLEDAAACPASCATATVAAALRTAGELHERVVVVQGAGLLGLTACAMARDAGAAEVVCSDPAAERLRQAGAFGATRLASPGDLAATVSAASAGYGADVLFELSGSPAAFEAGLPLLRMGGVYVLVGAVFPTRPVPVAMDVIVRRQLTVSGVHNYAAADLGAALGFLDRARGYPFAGLVADWFPLAAADDAFRRAAEPGVVRVGVRP